MEEINNFILQLLATITCGRERSCLSKRRYKSEEHAGSAAKKLSARPTQRHPVEEYGCPWCYGWHVGRPLSRSKTLYLAWGARGVEDGQDQTVADQRDGPFESEVPASGGLGTGLVLQAHGAGEGLLVLQPEASLCPGTKEHESELEQAAS